MDYQKRYYLKRKDAPDETCSIIPFKRNEVIIGRSADATYVIPNNLISRKHAVFTRSGDTWIVKNLSLNGVFINDELVPKEEQKEVKVGDVVQFGQPATFVYRFGMKVPRAGSSRQGSITQSAKRIKSTDKRSDVEANLNKLNDIQTLEARLQGERDHLEVSLHQEKDNLQQQYQREKEDLEMQFAAGALAQQVMLEEKEALARRLEKQVLELQTRLEQEHKALEERLRKEEEERHRINQEKEDVLQELEEKKRHLERKMQEERQHLQDQLQATESHREELQKEVEAKEAMIRAKEEEQSRANQERQQLKDELALEKQALKEELEKVRHALQEKKEQFSELDSELKSKEVEMQDKMMSMESGVQERVMAEVEKNSAMVREEATKQLEEIKKEKIKLEEKLKQAQVQDQEQLSNLQEALETVEAQKLSLEQELACTAIASDNARKEVVESVSDVLETELQCPICNELFITAIMLGCSHTFCKYCIDQWKKNKRECPNCRAPISSETRSLVVDNFIEKIVPTLSDEMKSRRSTMVTERNAEMAAVVAAQAAAAAARASNRGGRRGRGRGRNADGGAGNQLRSWNQQTHPQHSNGSQYHGNRHRHPGQYAGIERHVDPFDRRPGELYFDHSSEQWVPFPVYWNRRGMSRGLLSGLSRDVIRRLNEDIMRM